MRLFSSEILIRAVNFNNTRYRKLLAAQRSSDGKIGFLLDYWEKGRPTALLGKYYKSWNDELYHNYTSYPVLELFSGTIGTPGSKVVMDSRETDNISDFTIGGWREADWYGAKDYYGNEVGFHAGLIVYGKDYEYDLQDGSYTNYARCLCFSKNPYKYIDYYLAKGVTPSSNTTFSDGYNDFVRAPDYDTYIDLS